MTNPTFSPLIFPSQKKKKKLLGGGWQSTNHAAKVRKLSLWVLDLICEGLGLESRYLREELSQVQLMAINHYPPCPDPSLTLGLPKHSDVNLITFLLQRESHGLQVLKDGQWLAIEPLPNAFVVNVCHMLHVCPFFFFFFTFNCPFFQQTHVSYFIS